MLHKIDTVIVGGGQAGLAISYCLTQEGREHVALERAPAVANAWRNQRCDSFTLVTPNFQVRMPGAEYSGDDPYGIHVSGRSHKLLRQLYPALSLTCALRSRSVQRRKGRRQICRTYKREEL